MLNRADEIKEKHAAAMERAASRRTNLPLIDVLDDVLTTFSLMTVAMTPACATSDLTDLTKF
jgi:hypothetical protein